MIIDLASCEMKVSRTQFEKFHIEGCPLCGSTATPEPTDDERDRIISDPDYNWSPPEGNFMYTGYGLAGGGCGTYIECGWGFFAKVLDEDEALDKTPERG